MIETRRVDQGEFYEAALADGKAATQFHIESFGTEAFDDDSDVETDYVAVLSRLYEIPGRCATKPGRWSPRGCWAFRLCVNVKTFRCDGRTPTPR
jgi:hypothetical protein